MPVQAVLVATDFKRSGMFPFLCSKAREQWGQSISQYILLINGMITWGQVYDGNARVLFKDELLVSNKFKRSAPPSPALYQLILMFSALRLFLFATFSNAFLTSY